MGYPSTVELPSSASYSASVAYFEDRLQEEVPIHHTLVWYLLNINGDPIIDQSSDG